MATELDMSVYNTVREYYSSSYNPLHDKRKAKGRNKLVLSEPTMRVNVFAPIIKSPGLTAVSHNC